MDCLVPERVISKNRHNDQPPPSNAVPEAKITPQQIPNPDQTSLMQAIVSTVLELEPGILQVRFTASQPLDYTAGQFVELTVSHDKPDGRGIQRWFTLSSSPTEHTVHITTRTSARVSSFKRALSDLKPGDHISISQAMGDFVLPIQKNIPILFVVAGIGVTPVRSIVKSLIDTGIRRDIQLLHIGPSPESLPYRAELQAYVPHIIDISNSESAIRDCTAATKTYLTQNPEARVYVSGPEEFTEKLYSGLTQIVPASRIVTDYFHGYAADD